MNNYTIEDFKNTCSAVINSIIECIKEQENSLSEEQTQLMSQLEDKSTELLKVFDVAKINYCIKRYVDAELDYKTQGVRGLGRHSECTPRLGAYFRKQISKLIDEDITVLRYLIYNLIMSGYIANTFYFSEDEIEVNDKLAIDLFKEWIPGIYVFPFEDAPENLQTFYILCVSKSFKNLQDFLLKHRMKRHIFTHKDELNVILSYYGTAGFLLRHIEKVKLR